MLTNDQKHMALAIAAQFPERERDRVKSQIRRWMEWDIFTDDVWTDHRIILPVLFASDKAKKNKGYAESLVSNLLRAVREQNITNIDGITQSVVIRSRGNPWDGEAKVIALPVEG